MPSEPRQLSDHLWSLGFLNGSTAYPVDVRVGPDDSPVLVGRFTTLIDLGGGFLNGTGGFDVFVTKRMP